MNTRTMRMWGLLDEKGDLIVYRGRGTLALYQDRQTARSTRDQREPVVPVSIIWDVPDAND